MNIWAKRIMDPVIEVPWLSVGKNTWIFIVCRGMEEGERMTCCLCWRQRQPAERINTIALLHSEEKVFWGYREAESTTGKMLWSDEKASGDLRIKNKPPDLGRGLIQRSIANWSFIKKNLVFFFTKLVRMEKYKPWQMNESELIKQNCQN